MKDLPNINCSTFKSITKVCDGIFIHLIPSTLIGAIVAAGGVSESDRQACEISRERARGGSTDRPTGLGYI